MDEERKGFLTPEQEEQTDAFIELNGIWEALDGPVIRIADNTGLQKAKEKLQELQPEAVKIIYMVIDEVYAALPSTAAIKAMHEALKKQKPNQ